MTRAVGILLIPAIALALPIVPAPIANQLHAIPDSGAGWLEGTGWIYDAKWRVVLGGHTPGDFARLHELAVGDLVIVVGERGAVHYRITEVLYADARDVSYLMPTRVHTLTLITCTDDDDVRLIVNAERLN